MSVPRADILHMSSKLMVSERVFLYGFRKGVFGPGKTLEVCVECLWTPHMSIVFLLLLLCILCYNKSQRVYNLLLNPVGPSGESTE